MNNHALLAALGRDAVDAVDGYRLAALAEAERRRLFLVPEAPQADAAVGRATIDETAAIDIRMVFVYCRAHPELAGRTLHWVPEHGWSMSHRLANRPLCYYAGGYHAGVAAEPLQLVPTPPELLDWAVADPIGAACPPVGVRLDDGAHAIDRLRTFLDPGPRRPIREVPRHTDVEE